MRLCAPSSNVLCKPWDQVPDFAGQQCHSSQSSGHHRFLAAHSPDLAPVTLAKNYPTPVDVYQLTRVLQQVWQSKLFRPLSSPQVSAAYIMAAIPAVDCHETSCICDFKIEGWSHFRAHISCCYLKSNESCINCC